MSVQRRPARSYRSAGPRVSGWGVCGADALQIVGERRIAGPGSVPGREGLTNRRWSLFREGHQASDGIPVSLHDKTIPTVANPSQDVTKLPGQFRGGDPVFHIDIILDSVNSVKYTGRHAICPIVRSPSQDPHQPGCFRGAESAPLIRVRSVVRVHQGPLGDGGSLPGP